MTVSLCTSVTIGVAITSPALIFSSAIPGVLKPVLAPVSMALSNAMACRVYRAFLLGVLKDPQIDTATVLSFDHAADIRDDDTLVHDTLSNRPSKSAMNADVETDPGAEGNDEYAFWQRRLTTYDVEQDVSRWA
jgi:hypothetical protein